MSLWRDELKAAPSTIATLIVLGAIAISSLSRVVAAPASIGWATAGAVIGGSLALYLGRRSLGLAFAIVAAATVFTLPMLFLRDAEEALLPTPSALGNIRELVAAGFSSIPKVVPPVQAEPKFTILIWLSFLLLGFLCAAWVVVRRPVGAVVSMLAIVTFSGSVGDTAGRNAYAIAAIAATGAFFLAEGRHRIARWAGGQIHIPAWLGVPTLVVACVVALGAPAVLGETPIVQLRSAIQPRIVIIKPLSDIKRQLKVEPPLEVLRVTSDRATYWRLTGLDSYDGNEWVLEARPRELREGVVPPAKPPVHGDILAQTYRLTSLLAPWLPAAYAAESVESEAQIQVDEGSQTLLLRDETTPGLTYTVYSRQPKVSSNREVRLQPSDDPRAAVFAQQARSIVGDARTPLDMARKLEAHFRSYNYDEDVDGGHTVDRLQRFLAERRGYCEQFAATMTLMLRSLGIPARVGVGFLPGTHRGSEYVVSTRDAHAWVEANLPDAGWYTFDPTPGRAQAASIPPEVEEQPTEPDAPPQVSIPPQVTPAPEDLPGNVTGDAGFRIPTGVLWGALAVAAVGSIPTAKRIRRNRRRNGRPDVAVAGAYAELVDTARDLGRRTRGSETLREFVARISPGDQQATHLASLTGRALYGPGSSERADVSAAWTALGSTEASLRKRTPWWRRVIAFVDVRTFIPADALRRLRFQIAPARAST